MAPKRSVVTQSKGRTQDQRQNEYKRQKERRLAMRDHADAVAVNNSDLAELANLFKSQRDAARSQASSLEQQLKESKARHELELAESEALYAGLIVQAKLANAELAVANEKLTTSDRTIKDLTKAVETWKKLAEKKQS